MNKPHKHAEVIKAWADGAEIEFKHCDGSWYPDESPKWHKTWEYRVKHVEIPEGFLSYDGVYGIPLRHNLKGYDFLLTNGTVEFRASGDGIPCSSVIIAYRPVPKKVVRWLWIKPDDPIVPCITTCFYSEEEIQRTFLHSDKMIKAEWTRTEFDA